MSKINFPALILLLSVIAVIVVLVVSMPSESDRRFEVTHEGENSVSEAAVEPAVDESGRWIAWQ